MTMDDATRVENQMRDSAVVRLWNALLPLKSVVSFMNTGAHPDDETSAMLAALSRRDGIQLSHACSTRGEGGQNALGTEISEDLGMVRTREMERAADVLDMTQYWLGESPKDTIFDFGFSKSGEETLAKWGHERILDRFVRILRRERPDIVCPTFLDVPGQHGHHRAMTQAAHEAVILAADRTAYPHHFDDGLSVWQVKKLYLPAWSGAGDSYDDDLPPPPATVNVDAGGRDPVLGATFAQIGQWSRVFHKTQGMGRWIESGAEASYPLHLAWSASGRNDPEENISDGLPGSLGNLADWAKADEIRRPLERADDHIAAALAAWPDNAAVANASVKALQQVREAMAMCPDAASDEVLHRLERKERQLVRVVFEASGIVVSASARNVEVIPGGETVIDVQVDDPLALLDGAPKVVLNVPSGWTATLDGDGSYLILLPDEAELSNPYPDTYEPLGSSGFVSVDVSVEYEGVTLSLRKDLEEPLSVVPRVQALIAPSSIVYNLAAPNVIEVQVEAIDAEAADLEVPAGWGVTKSAGTICVRPPADLTPELYCLPLKVAGGQAMTVRRADYPHTGTVARFLPTALSIRAFSARLPAAQIGYVGGGSDRVGHWLGAMGLNVTELDDAMIRDGRFADFDTIVVGIFALRTRPELAKRTAVLHDWVRAGGNLVTLYHRPMDNWDPRGSAPGHLEIGKPSLRWRVTDENAEVTHLDPNHKLLTMPNKIGPDDWAGWHKERGLYFASRYNDVYTPLLEMADPGEAPHRGSLLTAEIGAGRHTHTSLILHHQMEKLVPGAFRLMANLVTPVETK
jgi:LmbE family N-acetylglucosaminyl deacetylase